MYINISVIPLSKYDERSRQTFQIQKYPWWCLGTHTYEIRGVSGKYRYITCRQIRKLFMLLWQHCRLPWSFTCEPCSFYTGRTGFVWVRRVWNGSADPKTRQMRGAFRHMISQRKSWTHRKKMIFWTQLWLEMKHGFSTTLLNPSKLGKSSTTMRCKKKSWRGSEGWLQTSMTRGYRSWFQVLIYKLYVRMTVHLW